MITYTCDLCDIEIQGAMSTTHKSTNSDDTVFHFHLGCWTYLFHCGGLDAAKNCADADLELWDSFDILNRERELDTTQELNDAVYTVIDQGPTTLTKVFEQISLDCSNDQIADAVSALIRTAHVKVFQKGRVPILETIQY